MKLITDVEELIVGEHYWLVSKRYNNEVVLGDYKPSKCFLNRVWTYKENNQGMEHWHIIGPVPMPKFEDAEQHLPKEFVDGCN